MARRIIRTFSYTPKPSTRTVIRRKDGKLTANQKWLNSLGKTGMFDWEIRIEYDDGTSKTKTMKFDTIDDARAWSCNRFQSGQIYFIDGIEVVSR